MHVHELGRDTRRGGEKVGRGGSRVWGGAGVEKVGVAGGQRREGGGPRALFWYVRQKDGKVGWVKWWCGWDVGLS